HDGPARSPATRRIRQLKLANLQSNLRPCGFARKLRIARFSHASSRTTDRVAHQRSAPGANATQISRNREPARLPACALSDNTHCICSGWRRLHANRRTSSHSTCLLRCLPFHIAEFGFKRGESLENLVHTNSHVAHCVELLARGRRQASWFGQQEF